MAKAATKRTGKAGEKGGRAVAARPEAYHPLEGFRREMDRLVDDFFGGRGLSFPRRLFDWDVEPFAAWGGARGAVAPHIDVQEDAKAFTIEAELPGMDEKDIELNMSDGMLTLKGEKKEESEKKEKDYFLSERRYGSFQRSFRVPESVDRDKVAADFKKGVLTITLPKSAKARKAEKKIKIKS